MSTGETSARSRPAAEAGEEKKGVALVRAQLRRAILKGELAPGEELTQTKLAQRLGVSRTPLREALRMLQEEGLVEAKRNRRMRVTELSFEDLESIYAHRILLEPLGAMLTVPRLAESDLQALSEAVRRMEGVAASEDLSEWARANAHFHDLLVMHAEKRLRDNIRRYAEASERYRRLRIEHGPDARKVGQAEHRSILEACQGRDASAAAARLARHLAHTALGLVAQGRPERNPAAVRAALRLVLNRHGEEPREDGKLASHWKETA